MLYRTCYMLAENFTLKVLTRLAHKVLGISKLKYIWQFLTVCMSLVLNIFIKKRLITKSNVVASDSNVISWSNTIRYLGVNIVAGHKIISARLIWSCLHHLNVQDNSRTGTPQDAFPHHLSTEMLHLIAFYTVTENSVKSVHSSIKVINVPHLSV